jgi:hypothetical protein
VRIHGGNFLRLVHLAADANVSGPLTLVFRPAPGEFAVPHAGTKAKFDLSDPSMTSGRQSVLHLNLHREFFAQIAASVPQKKSKRERAA